jgi:4-hydroxy-3-polyprenylbenzoate decarboxylase
VTYHRDLRQFIDFLEERGKVHRFGRVVDKDTELMALTRVQLRGVPAEQRKVLLFEQITDANGGSYDMGVAANVYGASSEILALGIGCGSPREFLQKWQSAVENPIVPSIVDSGTVQEVVHVGDALTEAGLDIIPVPVEEPGFSQMIRTGMPTITRDAETGITNTGTYNGFFRDRTRIVAGITLQRETIQVQLQSWRRAGEEMPIAIVIGASPNLMLTSSASLPYGTDELAVAGGLVGEPLEMIRCKTIPLEVPAHAELVIEGRLSAELFEPRLGFGEYPGYLNVERHVMPVMTVTAITHRRNALFTPVSVGFPPSDCNILSSFANAATMYRFLRHACGFPVDDVYFPQMAGGTDTCIIRLEKRRKPTVARRVLDTVAGAWTMGKYFVVVDNDINIRDPDIVLWALSFAVRPESDIIVHPGRWASLDPSYEVPHARRGQTESMGDMHSQCRLLIDATRHGPYPPVALPRREYMERALEIWREEPGLPEPRVREPWYGYELGSWEEDDQEFADLIVKGDYKAVGRRAAQMQVTLEEY